MGSLGWSGHVNHRRSARADRSGGLASIKAPNLERNLCRWSNRKVQLLRVGLSPELPGGPLRVPAQDPELGPKVYNATGESSFFSLKNLVSNSTLEVPQKQWKDPFDLARSAINPNTSAVPDEDYTSSERKVADISMTPDFAMCCADRVPLDAAVTPLRPATWLRSATSTFALPWGPAMLK